MIRTFKHKGLRRLFEEDDRKLIRPDLVPRVATVLALLEAASAVEDLATPSLRLHPLKGDLKGRWAVTVRAYWRIVFAFGGGDAPDVDLVDYH